MTYRLEPNKSRRKRCRRHLQNREAERAQVDVGRAIVDRRCPQFRPVLCGQPGFGPREAALPETRNDARTLVPSHQDEFARKPQSGNPV